MILKLEQSFIMSVGYLECNLAIFTYYSYYMGDVL